MQACGGVVRVPGKVEWQRTANLLSVQDVLAGDTGQMIKGNELKKLTAEDVAEWLSSPELVLAVESRLQVITTLDEQMERIEAAARARGELRPQYRVLRSMKGIGQALGLTIMYR